MITPRVQAALDELVAAIQESTISSFQAMLSGGPASAKSAQRATAALAARPAAKSRAKGAKRSPEEIEAQTKLLLATIKKNPGLRIEEISKMIGVSTKELALPVIKLFEAKAISSKGNRRATRYFPR
jgi:predicted O-methyltransferase YrrM